MTILEETPEFLFIQHATSILDAPNIRPDLEPGGLWIKGKIRLSWGMRTISEPPTLTVNGGQLAGSIPLPYDLPSRLAIMRITWQNRQNLANLATLDFREVVTLSAILAWQFPDDDDPDDP
jgi:hypothetical protein